MSLLVDGYVGKGYDNCPICKIALLPYPLQTEHVIFTDCGTFKETISFSKKADDLKGNENSPLKYFESVSSICCVPECFNNSRRNAKVNFIFPKVIALRDK